MKLSDKQISATILGVSLVIGAFLMKPPRYEDFPVENPQGQTVHGTLDTQTGELCLHILRRQDGFPVTRCSPR